MATTQTAFVSKYALITALINGGAIESLGIAIVCAVEREGGSGRCFNVTGYMARGDKVTRFVRTTD